MGNEQASGANDFYSHGGAGRFAASGGLGRASVFSADRGRGPPPVSANKISKYLAPINVTADDLLEESNKECKSHLASHLFAGSLTAQAHRCDLSARADAWGPCL